MRRTPILLLSVAIAVTACGPASTDTSTVSSSSTTGTSSPPPPSTTTSPSSTTSTFGGISVDYGGLDLLRGTATTTTSTAITTTVEPAAIEVSYPKEGAIVTHKSKLFMGNVHQGCSVAASDGVDAVINERGPRQPDSAPSGWWMILDLDPGENTMTFTATCPSGSPTEAHTTVFYDPKPFVFYDQIVLRSDGLGVVDFGAPVDEALNSLKAVLGSPDSEYSCVPEGDLDPCAYGHPAENYYAEAHWRLNDGVGLTVTFSDWHLFRDDAVPHFDAWYLSHSDMLYRYQSTSHRYLNTDSSMPFDIRTPLTTGEGIGIGATVSQLQDAYGETLDLPTTPSECTGWFEFRLGGAPGWLGGVVCGEPTDPLTRICILNAGQRSSC